MAGNREENVFVFDGVEENSSLPTKDECKWSGLDSSLRTIRMPLAFASLAAAVLLLVVAQKPHATLPVAMSETVEFAGKQQCSSKDDNCNKTKCCTAAGAQCYAKDDSFAMCRGECTPGLDPVDPHPTAWSCEKIGERTPGHFATSGWEPKAAKWVLKTCANSSENCLKSGCCKDGGHACFKKNNSWARCKPSCSDGPDPTDVDNRPWNCQQLGGKTPGKPDPAKAASWVDDLCTASNESCAHSRCCKDPAHVCFEKNSSYARCRTRCTVGEDLTDPTGWTKWSCKQLGGRTPGSHNIAPHEQKLAPWVKEHCSDYGENCASSKCCKDKTAQCYEKFPGHGECMYKCLKDHKEFSHHKQCAKEAKGNTSDACKYDGKTWTCRELGPRTLRPWGWPSLFCLHVMRLYSYEAAIVKAQLQKDGRFRGGIFSCDQYAVYAHDTKDGTYLGDGPYGPVRTNWFQSAPVWRSKDNTAANTLLFMNMWEAVRWNLQYKCCDWTVKADPDAVLLPDRMRGALSHKMSWLNFVATCKGTLYGAVEAIQTKALEKYFWNEAQCRNMGWQSWGEDVWINRCLMSLGVTSTFDGGFVADNLCSGSYCGNGYSSGYHPFKDANAWMSCYYQATR
mmetsp:Transcript_78871/g.152306  ORF Transcript_78871/g.152306 Transcript_78871/m.152306 type:complete len:622 (-) Transcript_78871:430-2295(-)